MKQSSIRDGWPKRLSVFPDLMTPIEAAMFLRLDQAGHTPLGHVLSQRPVQDSERRHRNARYHNAALDINTEILEK